MNILFLMLLQVPGHVEYRWRVMGAGQTLDQVSIVCVRTFGNWAKPASCREEALASTPAAGSDLLEMTKWQLPGLSSRCRPCLNT